MFRFEQLAQDLAQAWRTGGITPLPEAGKGPTTRAEAYAIQDRMAELIGGQVVGWKVGATAPAVQLFEGHDGPIPGRIFADRCFESSARVPAGLLKNIKMECEFAFRTAQAIPSGTSLLRAEEIAEGLTFHPAFDLLPAAMRQEPATEPPRRSTELPTTDRAVPLSSGRRSSDGENFRLKRWKSKRSSTTARLFRFLPGLIAATP
jgi:2-keto-4-pentenoate hydratase